MLKSGCKPAAELVLFLGLFVTLALANHETDQKRSRKTMITDRLENASKYYHLHPSFAKAFAFLQQPGLAKLAPGKYVIDGDNVFCTIGKNSGKKKSEATLEAHRKYIDIQYVIDGSDEMGWRRYDDCHEISEAYKPEGDIEFFKDQPKLWKKINAGFFTIFFPQDAHAPLVSDGEINKVVVKIAVK
jgi:biofilm protein TabA